MQSDGTNSFKYIEIFLSLLISLTRRDYITPIVFIDEAEIGLHPKKSELLIENLHDIYMSFKKTKKLTNKISMQLLIQTYFYLLTLQIY